MKPVFFDSGEHLDDPNIYWANPAYKLEPGDPGYVDPFPVSDPSNKRTKRMKHNPWFPPSQGRQIIWLQTFGGKLPNHATALGLVAGVVTQAGNDCLWLVYLMEIWLPAVRRWAQSCTDFVAMAQSGTGGAALVLPAFTAPALPQGTTAQTPGGLDRLFTLVQSIKEGGKCTEDIATDLGIVGAADPGPDLTAVQPPLSAVRNGDHVDLKSGWGGQGKSIDSLELQKDWGDGKGYVYHATLTGVTFTDTSPLPAGRAVWAYRCIYRVANRQIGLWCTPVSVAVGG